MLCQMVLLRISMIRKLDCYSALSCCRFWVLYRLSLLEFEILFLMMMISMQYCAT